MLLSSARVRGVLAGLLLSAGLGSAMAMDDSTKPDHLLPYRAFVAAQQRGDVGAALKHAEAAWNAAEQTLGDHATTAVLAYNFARLATVYSETQAQALAAFERTLQLSQQPIEGIDRHQAQIGRDELIVRLGNSDSTVADRLAEELINLGESASPATDLSAQAWATLAENQLQRENRELAREYALQAVAHAEALQPANKRVLVQGLTTAAIADIQAPMRGDSDERLGEAALRLERAIDLFQAQTSLDDFDPRLARALLWRQAAATVSRSRDRIAKRERRPKQTPLPAFPTWSKVLPRERSDTDGCRPLGDYLESKPLRYPRQARRLEKIGSVLFGFEVEGTRITRSVILAEQQGAGFADATEQMLAEWTLREPYPEQCAQRFYLTTASFLF